MGVDRGDQAWEYTGMETIYQPNSHLPQEVREAIQRVEDEYTAYIDKHYGPMWGEQNEIEATRITQRLRRLYDEHDVDEFDRVAGV
jgi:hypothetical protein